MAKETFESAKICLCGAIKFYLVYRKFDNNHRRFI